MARVIERYRGKAISDIKVGTDLDVVLTTGNSFHGKLLLVENNQSVTLKISRQKVKFPIAEITEIIVCPKA